MMFKNRKTALLGALTFSLIGLANGQESINSGGGDYAGSGGQISCSFGQVNYLYHTSNEGSVQEGVQQAYDLFTVGIAPKTVNVSIVAFPNPTSDYLTLKVEGQNQEVLHYQIINQEGKLLQSGQFSGNECEVNLNKLADAHYFLSLFNSNNQQISSYKIIKTQ